MPTNLLRNSSPPGQRQPRPNPPGSGELLLTAGRVSLRIAFIPSATTDRLTHALPLHSVAETWGEAIHFKIHTASGRDRSARINATIGEVYFWAHEDRIIVPFGPTPISRPGECRLPAPCNLIGHVLDDPKALSIVTPGEKLSLVAIPAVRS